MRIGNIEIKEKVVLGPMAGITTLAYREFMKPFGVGLSYSEMISDCGIDFGNKRTLEYLATSEMERPIGLQLFGFSIERSSEAIKYLEENATYDILDINLGCPVFKVTKTGAGSACLKEPAKLYEYMKEICKISTKPVTAKIRLGWDENSINVFEVCELLEKAGVQAITVHCRTSKQGYSGKANYEAIKGLKDKMGIPLIVSGDIFSPEDALKAVEITKADAVMVARGGVGHPKLISAINKALNGETFEYYESLEEQVGFARDFTQKLIDLKGERTAILELRGILPKFFSGFLGFKKFRMQLAQNISTQVEIDKLFDGILKKKSL